MLVTLADGAFRADGKLLNPGTLHKITDHPGYTVQFVRVSATADTVFVMIKDARNTVVKKATIVLQHDNTWRESTFTIDPTLPIDPVADEFSRIKNSLPGVPQHLWVPHFQVGPATIRSNTFKLGIKIRYNRGAVATVTGGTALTPGGPIPPEVVEVAKATWLVVKLDGTLKQVHLWPGIGDEAENIRDAIHGP